MKYRYIWFRQELLEILNKNGYTHFYTKRKVDRFEDGRAFYFCEEEKKYGYVDVIPYKEIENIRENELFIKEMGLVLAIEHINKCKQCGNTFLLKRIERDATGEHILFSSCDSCGFVNQIQID